MSCAVGLQPAQATGPKGRAGPYTWLGGRRRAGLGTRALTRPQMLGTKATNVDTRGIQSNRHEEHGPRFLTLRRKEVPTWMVRRGIDPVVLDQKHQSYLEFSV